jgi:hypothetical protein
MRKTESFKQPQNENRITIHSRLEESVPYYIRGDVFITLRNSLTGEVESHELRNLVVKDASILIARLMANREEPPFSTYCLGVGTGDVGWPLLSPPAPTNTQRSLYAEITRKTFSNVQFVDSGGIPSAIPTNIVDFETTFSESEAVGPLMEMGLLGGNISTNLAVKNPVLPPNGPYNPLVDLTTKETMINYLTFPVISKPATSTMTIVWRLTF